MKTKTTFKLFKNKILLSFCTIVCLLGLTLGTVQAQVIKPFTPRSPESSPGTTIHKLKGDMAIIGNSNMEAQSGNSNGNVQMKYIDIDSDSGTVNSSSATLEFSNENGADPNDANIVYAGLYWTGRAHDEGISPSVFSVDGSSIDRYHGNSFNGYSLSIVQVEDNSSHTSGSNRRKATYTFTPDGNGDAVVFTFYSWSTTFAIVFTTWHSKVLVKVGNGPEQELDEELSNESTNDYISTLTVPFEINTGNQSLYIKSLRKNRTSNTINDNFCASIMNGKMLSKREIKFKHESANSYEIVTANENDIYFPSNMHGNMYSAYADVTNYVQSHGLGEYFGADIALLEGDGGGTGFYGGWSLVVIYSNPVMKSRNITLFDGHAYVVGSQTTSHDLYISGFETVPVGDVNVKIGYFAGEGDRDISGDYLRVKNNANDWVNLSHAENSTNNFFNSSIQTGGNSRNPYNTNNFGIDIGFIDLPNANNSILANGATDITFKFGTTQDTYIIPFFAFAIESFSTKGTIVNDANGLSDNQVNNSAINTVTLPILYANVLDGNGKVIDAILVDTNTGSFELRGLGDGEYSIQLSEVQGQIGQSPTIVVPEGWMFTGESNSGGTSDGVVDGKIDFVVDGGDVTGLLIGINKIPEAFDLVVLSDGGIDYTGDDFYLANPEAFKSLDDDGNIKQLVITEMPTIIDSFSVDGVVYDSSNFPTNGITLNTHNNGTPIEEIELYLKKADLDQLIRIPFYVIDEAGGESNEGAAYFQGTSILPVEMAYFKAFKKGTVNILEWETLMEIDNYGFYIERSADATNFEEIAFVETKGDTRAIYNYIDEKPLLTSYYRLKQMDIDGTINYSIVQRVDQDNIKEPIMVYPNPSNDRIYIKQGNDFVEKAYLINSAGQVVKTIQIKDAHEVLSIQHLSNGIYMLQIGEENIKIIKK